MKKFKNKTGNFWVAVPEPFLKHIDAAKEIITLHKGLFFLILSACFVVGWIFANRCKND
ncbi:MAG: hypothetical protein IPJ69_07595 [Deltaproteobacteria bacterium]|nr:MAG: hypothetical protein IPJ69_07595 [Deltaproteobacteria bacterium]